MLYFSECRAMSLSGHSSIHLPLVIPQLIYSWVPLTLILCTVWRPSPFFSLNCHLFGLTHLSHFQTSKIFLNLFQCPTRSFSICRQHELSNMKTLHLSWEVLIIIIVLQTHLMLFYPSACPCYAGPPKDLLTHCFLCWDRSVTTVVPLQAHLHELHPIHQP